MKRAMTGGAHRGPVAPTRQRRTIRFIQLLLVLTAAGLLAFAGYSYGRADGYDAGKRATEIDAPREPSQVQTIVLVVIAGLAFAAATILQGDSTVRVPTPSRLDELAGRAEQVAIEKAEEVAKSQSSS
jgi:TRAP-type C4-dicarboxylate transport system permease small subunit